MLTPIIQAASPVENPYAASAPVRLKELEILVGNILAAITPLGGLALFVVVILAGYKFITSEGDPKRVAEARSTLTLAITGIVLLALAFAILVIIFQITGNGGPLNFLIYR